MACAAPRLTEAEKLNGASKSTMRTVASPTPRRRPAAQLGAGRLGHLPPGDDDHLDRAHRRWPARCARPRRRSSARAPNTTPLEPMLGMTTLTSARRTISSAALRAVTAAHDADASAIGARRRPFGPGSRAWADGVGQPRRGAPAGRRSPVPLRRGAARSSSRSAAAPIAASRAVQRASRASGARRRSRRDALRCSAAIALDEVVGDRGDRVAHRAELGHAVAVCNDGDRCRTPARRPAAAGRAGRPTARRASASCCPAPCSSHPAVDRSPIVVSLASLQSGAAMSLPGLGQASAASSSAPARRRRAPAPSCASPASRRIAAAAWSRSGSAHSAVGRVDPLPVCDVDHRRRRQQRALVVHEVEVAAVARGDRRRPQPHRLGEVQAETLAAVQRHEAVGGGDQRHLVGAARCSSHTTMSSRPAAAAISASVVHPAPGGVHRLDHQHRPLVRARTPGGTRAIAPSGFLRSVMLKWSKRDEEDGPLAERRRAPGSRRGRDRPAAARPPGSAPSAPARRRRRRTPR